MKVSQSDSEQTATNEIRRRRGDGLSQITAVNLQLLKSSTNAAISVDFVLVYQYLALDLQKTSRKLFF